LYPTVLFGPGSRTDGNLVGKMVYWIVNNRFPGIVGTGRQVWSYAYLDDVVRGHVAAVSRGVGGESYILGGENIALEDLVRQVYGLLERPFRVRRIPIPVAEALGWCAEQAAKLNKNPPELTKGVAGVYREHWSYSSERASRALGYRITPFAEALAATVRWARGLERW
jgi:nucleoside-diphosphate-sugar epimerase